ncbi:MAG: hypothetical protein HOY78_19110, partial [Saccharothrix sp.]|nr:hypothetical protein [Saccharothrix sp.]
GRVVGGGGRFAGGAARVVGGAGRGRCGSWAAWRMVARWVAAFPVVARVR